LSQIVTQQKGDQAFHACHSGDLQQGAPCFARSSIPDARQYLLQQTSLQAGLPINRLTVNL